MEMEINGWASAWIREPIRLSVAGTVLSFLGVTVIKGAARWLWAAVGNIPRRLEHWASRSQSLL